MKTLWMLVSLLLVASLSQAFEGSGQIDEQRQDVHCRVLDGDYRPTGDSFHIIYSALYENGAPFKATRTVTKIQGNIKALFDKYGVAINSPVISMMENPETVSVNDSIGQSAAGSLTFFGKATAQEEAAVVYSPSRMNQLRLWLGEHLGQSFDGQDLVNMTMEARFKFDQDHGIAYLLEYPFGTLDHRYDIRLQCVME